IPRRLAYFPAAGLPDGAEASGAFTVAGAGLAGGLRAASSSSNDGIVATAWEHDASLWRRMNTGRSPIGFATARSAQWGDTRRMSFGRSFSIVTAARYTAGFGGTAFASFGVTTAMMWDFTGSRACATRKGGRLETMATLRPFARPGRARTTSSYSAWRWSSANTGAGDMISVRVGF